MEGGYIQRIWGIDKLKITHVSEMKEKAKIHHKHLKKIINLTPGEKNMIVK